MKSVKIVALSLICVGLNADVLKNASLKVENKHVLAKDLQKGNSIDSASKSKILREKSCVINAQESTCDSMVEIDLGYKVINAAGNQTFYDPMLRRWIVATSITDKNHLLTEDMTPISVKGAQKINGKFETMKIGVDGTHYMFADGVLTHNFLWIPAMVGFIGYMVKAYREDKRGGGRRGGSGSGSVGGAHAANRQMRTDHNTNK